MLFPLEAMAIAFPHLSISRQTQCLWLNLDLLHQLSLTCVHMCVRDQNTKNRTVQKMFRR